MLVTSLSSAAAERGFYVGATASRVEQDLEWSGGLLPIAVFVPGPPVSGIIPRPLPPIFVGNPISAVPVILQPDRVEVDDVDAGWSVALGYRINEYLAVELAYMDFGEASVTRHYELPGVPPLQLPPRDFVESNTVNVRGPAASVLGSFPLSTNWQVFLRGGVLFADREIESAVTFAPGATARNEQSFGDEVWLAGAGVQWSFAPRWTARLEYQSTGDMDGNRLAGESSIDQASLSVLFSL
jgi:hypothetical protein